VIALLIALNVIAGLFLIAVVLLQSGKGADMGAAFGGSSTTVFGASGAGNLLTKLTAGSAAIFMGTSLILAVISTRDQSVFANSPEPAAAVPAATDAAAVPPPSGQPSDGVDAKAAAEARGQEPLVADETDTPGTAPAPGAGDLGPAGQAGEAPGALGAASPPTSDTQREQGADTGAVAAGEPATGGAAEAPAADAVKTPEGDTAKAPTGEPPPNAGGARPAAAEGGAAAPQ
jgi:preprotein translocase subunit SecG